MAHEQFQIEKYSVHLKRDAARQGASPIPSAYVYCTKNGGVRRCVFIIQFWLDVSVAPENTSVSRSDALVGYMHVAAEQYPWYIDLLRNEKPVLALVYEDPENNGLAVRYEDVGEGEV